MRICLINPGYSLDPSEDADSSLSGFTVPHLGLGYICSFLKQKGYEVDLMECMAQNISIKAIIEKIAENDYSVIGISVYDNNRINSLRIVRKIRKIKPNVFIFLGGYCATLSFQTLLKTFNVDCCIVGEGEITTLELVETLEKREDFKKTKGIAYLHKNQVVVTEKRELINNLDVLPFPERVFYRNKTLTMITSRGCFCHCVYCSIASFYRKSEGCCYRIRSAEDVFEEIIFLHEKYPECKLIWYFDDNFLQSTKENRTRLVKLCNLLKQNNIFIPFNITTCAKDIIKSEDVLRELKRVGLNQVFVGIESLCQRQLDFYNKNATVEENIEAIQILKNLNVNINMGFIPMDPYVTIAEIKMNFEMLKKYNILNDAYNVFSIHMYIISVEGTALKEILDRERLSRNNDKGYCFVNDEVNYLHDILKKWHKIISPMVSKADLIEGYQEIDKNKFAVLNEIYNNLIRLDIDYVIFVCSLIEKSSNSTIDETHIFWWEMQYNRLYEGFLEAQNNL